MNAPDGALDVWLRLAVPECANCGVCEDCLSEFSPYAESEAEANTYPVDGQYRVSWYLTAVGLVKYSPCFDTYPEACAWLEAEGFQDYTVND